MPESVTDRCTKSHEYMFLMTKKPRYYYDAEAIKEESIRAGDIPGGDNNRGVGEFGVSSHAAFNGPVPATRNKRSVWTVPTCPYPEAHFATFPPDLIEPCILAGCPEWVCKKCGEPRRRIVESELSFQSGSGKSGNLISGKNGPDMQGGGATGDIRKGPCRMTTTTGWTDCGCNAGFDGGIVLDPFMGAGTVAAVAYENNRHYIGIELNPDEKIQKRITDVLGKYPLFPE